MLCIYNANSSVIILAVYNDSRYNFDILYYVYYNNKRYE